jgi:DNA ligase (NAD+)
LEELEGLDGIGPIIAQAVYQYVREDENRERMGRLAQAGFTLREPSEDAALEPTLSGKAVVVTGAVAGYTREGAEAAIVARGGTSPGSVSKKTFCVVVGEAPGASKLTKAEELGIPIVSAENFESLLVSGVLPA